MAILQGYQCSSNLDQRCKTVRAIIGLCTVSTKQVLISFRGGQFISCWKCLTHQFRHSPSDVRTLPFVYKLNEVHIFSRTENFHSRRQAFARSQYGLLRSEEKLALIIFNTLVVWVLVCSAIFYGHCGKWQLHCNGKCCSHCIMMADAVGMHYVRRCYVNRFIKNLSQMLLPHNIVVLCGRCYGLACSASGRCYCHKWQMK